MRLGMFMMPVHPPGRSLSDTLVEDTTKSNGASDLRGAKDANYTQQDAKDIIDRNTADDNSAFMRVAERIVQQQDAAISSPTALRASIPEQGRVLTFKRAVLVDPWAVLRINLKTTAATAASSGTSRPDWPPVRRDGARSPLPRCA